MDKAIEYKRNIDLQIRYNRSKNLFCNSTKNVFSFAPETIVNLDMMRKMDGWDQELLIS